MPRITARSIRVGRAASFVLLLTRGLMAQDVKRHPDFDNVPLYFEENRGQTGSRARYIARSASLVGFVTQDGWTLSLNGHPISMHIKDANAKAPFAPEGSVEGITNYYLGARAITALPHYSGVRAHNIRPGIDVVYHGSERDLEYDLVIHPGADVGALRLRFEGSRPALADNGDIVLKTGTGEARQRKPRVWQETKGQRTEVECTYTLLESGLESGEVGLSLSKYDRSAQLIVDPVISYSTYLTGTSVDTPAGIAVDGSGYAYVAGTTLSMDFPVTSGTYQGGPGDVFVTKLNPSGTALIYSTFIGGTSQDMAYGIAIDNAGNAYVTGSTNSTNFPVTVNQFTSGLHAFALKLGSTGNIVYSTALAGNSSDTGLAIAADASGSAYVAGNTFSTNFPVTVGSYKTTPGGGGDAFVAKLSSTGQISYATYLGGSASDSAAAIAVDASGNAFVGGVTSSANFPATMGAYATAYAGNQDGFVVKLNPAGSSLVYATFLGGSSTDSLNGLALDAAGNCYVTGATESTDFPTTPGAFETTWAFGFKSGFVTKLNATGTALVYSTFLSGANGDDSAVAIAVDSNGVAYVAGSAHSPTFPTTPGALKKVQATTNCCDLDMFLSRVAIDGSALLYSTRLGSSGTEGAFALALDPVSGVYIAGVSQDSLIYPTTSGAYQASGPKSSSQRSFSSVVITKIDFNASSLCVPVVSPQSQNLPGHGGTISFSLTLSPGCPWEAVPSSTSTLTLNNPTYGVASTSPITITGTVPQNSNTVSGVTQTVRIGTATFTVTQDAGSCQDSAISPPSVAFGSSGGLRNLSLTLPSSCNWTAVPGAPWLSVSTNPNGTGPATIAIFAAVNSFSARSTTLTLAGKTINVTQSGSTCTATANALLSSTSSQGSDGVVSITTNSSACTWNAYALAPWIQLNNSASTGQGSGLAPFIVAANPGAIPRTGQILIADLILSITQDAGPAGTINGYSASVFAGGGPSSTPNLGDGGPALGAYLYSPAGLAFDSAAGSLYIVDFSSRVRVVTPDGNINTFAGGGSGTGENIPATSALLSNAEFVAVDSSSAVYVNDSDSRVRKISQGNIVTFAGGSNPGFSGDNGPATSAQLNAPRGMAADSSGNVYIADTGNNRVRKVNAGTITAFAGGGNAGLGDNGPATAANLSGPRTVALDVSANLVIADVGNIRVRKVAQGIITTIAGGGSGGDGGPATSASIFNPIHVAVDTIGNVFVYESAYFRIRKVSLDGTISTIATNASVQGLAADKSGNLYFSDWFNNVILVRKLTALPSFCTYSVSTPAQIPQSGGSVQISITTAAGCRWGALLVPAWLTPNSATTGTGNGAISFTASTNSDGPRSATLAIGGMPVQVSQSGSTAPASLSILKTHAGNSFAPGQQNAVYSITVSNAASAGPTTGLVTVTENLPSGLTLVGMAGSGWTCQTTSCTRSDVLNGGASYTPITVTVNVAANATSPQVNQATVSGGGSASASASDSTTIATPTFSINRTVLNFNTANGIATSLQTVTVTFTGGVPWTATSNQSNIVVTQGSGNGNGSFQVAGNAGPNGIVTVTAPNATGSPKQIQVNISTPLAGNPFGSFDTPVDNTTGVAGAIPVTGWALDNVEVIKVDLWREPVGAEPAGVLINIGDALFVEGARPDVEGLNPNVPFNYRAGWGYQLLTNFLPTGNGTFKLHAIAHNKAGNSTDLGTKTITVDNAHATKPFGTIDTPGQGGSASGNAFVNFGWALCPNPNKIPIDGSTISVIIDGQPVGHPTYNQFRSDIAAMFPGYMNSGGAVGYFYVDTTKLSNGVHTISWNVFDNVNNGAGIGSRYFNVFNSGNMEQSLPTVTARKNKPVTEPRPQGAVPRTVEIEEVGQIELPLAATTGYQLVNGEHRPLPIGSSLKRGVFYWQPGPGFLGEYHLVFEHQDGTESQVRVKIRPKTYRPNAGN